VKSDGYDLGAQRRKIDRSDLPDATVILKSFSAYVRTGQDKESIETFVNGSGIGLIVPKEKISESGDFNLSVERYKDNQEFISIKYPSVKLKELEDFGDITLGRGKIISKIDIERIPGEYPVYSSSAQGNGEFGKYGNYMFDEELITWSVDGGGRSKNSLDYEKY
jgi:hypothetical protein